MLKFVVAGWHESAMEGSPVYEEKSGLFGQKNYGSIFNVDFLKKTLCDFTKTQLRVGAKTIINVYSFY